MKNDLINLQNRVFDLFDDLKAKNLTGDDLRLEIDRHLALNEIAKTAVTNAALMAKAADTLYGLPVSDKLPLIPSSEAETPVILSKRKNLINLPKNKV